MNSCNHVFLLARSYGSNVRKTRLHEFHVRHGGKMVPFAGYMMPVKYTDSIASSHLHTRRQCSMFDVSHMLQTKIHGKHREQFMERICVTDVQSEYLRKNKNFSFSLPRSHRYRIGKTYARTCKIYGHRWDGGGAA